MKNGHKIELLSPAKNLECGIEAFNHGADAVYIGAPQFSARAAAGNSIEDIRTLCDYAHQYLGKVYVALNTIIKDSEIADVEKMVWDIYEAGADALIIQDMGFFKMNLPPIPLHASTQTDNRTVEKVKFLEDAGFSQVVLARELSLDQIKEIADQTKVALEFFVHGSLCVCYSGQCYISQAYSGRSANRGACAQYCRLPYTLQDATGNTLATNKYLLSLKDLNLSEQLEELLDAGICSLKIEGRLKDLSYVKNITAYYRQKLDEILLRRPEFVRASSGHCRFDFVPHPDKSFNRGFTDYFLKKRNTTITSFETPKSLGESIGSVKDLNKNWFAFSGNKVVNNGDGLCFINERKELEGFRVNKVESGRIFPTEMPHLLPEVMLYRNYNHEFEMQMLQKTAERKVDLEFVLEETDSGFKLTAMDEDGYHASVDVDFIKEVAQKDQKENIRTQLSKLGNTIFELKELKIQLSSQWFIPSSVLADLKRRVTDAISLERKTYYPRNKVEIKSTSHPYPSTCLTYLGNVANGKAKDFYFDHAVTEIENAFELTPQKNVPLMFTKHCIRYSLGYCARFQDATAQQKEPLYLLTGQHRFTLKFNCTDCEMMVYG